MYAFGSLDAKALCELTYWITAAGGSGVDDLGAMKPGQSTGNYSKHVKLILGLSDEEGEVYNVDVPLYSKLDLGHARQDI